MKKFLYPLAYLLLSGILLISTTGILSAEKDYSIKFVWGDWQVSENINQFVEEKISPEEITQGYYFRFIQFYDIPSNGVRKQLEDKGIKFLSYIPNYVYVTTIPATFDKSVLKSYNIRSVVPIDRGLKMHLNLLMQTYPAHALIGNDEIQLVISHYKNLDHSNVVNKLNQLNVNIIHEYSELRNLTIQVPLTEIDDIAGLPYIEYVEPILPPGEPEDYEGRSLHRSNAINSYIPTSYQYDGEGVKMAVNDDGFVGPHIDFTGRIDNSEVANDFTGSHGDGVAGIAGGAGNLNPRNAGMATGAFLKIRQYDSSLPGVINLHQIDSVMMFNSSYSNGCNAGYTNVTVQVDDEIADNPSLIQIFSAGNSNNNDCGYGAGNQWGNITGGHKMAKNGIATANLFFDDALVNSSSRGPASDGRIKPDLAANGQNQVSTDPGNQYSPFGGTSGAAPGIMGCAAQLYHAYKDLNGGALPESPLIKAAMLNTAYDLGNPGPDFKYGWGRINALKALRLIEEARYLSDTISQGGTNTHDIIIPTGIAQAKIMIYWLDPAGTTTAAKALVNDLNARIFTPSSDTLLPLVLDETPNTNTLDLPAVPGVDDLNNVEQVRIDNPAAGTYTFEVNGFTVPFGPQKYYVVVEYEIGEIEVTYPQGGEGFSPGQVEVIRWDAFADTSTFNVEYSTDDGLTWNTIVSGINGNVRHYAWNPPSTITSEALVKVTRDGVSGISEANFTIIGIPSNIVFNYACPDSFEIAWTPVAGAAGYEVSMLGSKFMDAQGYTTSTVFTITGVNPIDEYWVSVRAVEAYGGYGDRAIAVQKSPGVFNCILAVDGIMNAIVSPNGLTMPMCQSTGSLDLSVDITNNGLSSISNIPVYYSVNNGTPVMETVPGPVAAGATITYTFTNQPSVPGIGVYDIATWIELTNDGNSFNDTLKFSYEIIPSVTVNIPYFDDFESFTLCNTSTDCAQTICNLTNGWINEENGKSDDIDFRTDNFGTPSNNTGPEQDHNPGTTSGKYVYTEASGGCSFQTASMISPCFNLLNSPNYQFRFWYHMWGGDMGELHVDILSNGQWIEDVIPPVSGNQGNNWNEGVVDLSPYVNQTINVRFRGITGNDWQSDIALDDIGISDFVGIEENNTANIQIYPNPANDLVNIQLSNLKGKNATLRLYDAIGKLIYEENISAVANSYKVNLNVLNFAEGAYMLEVENANGKSYSKLIVN